MSVSPASPDRQAISVPFIDSSASVLFDLLRGLAALLVLLSHWRNIFFIDFSDLTDHRLLLVFPYVLAAAGHQSVVVFFVLSGFFISGAVFRSVKRNQWNWADYLTRRLVRLWVVLLPALLLCLFWDSLGLHLARAPALYSGNVRNHIVYNIPPLISPSIFFGNLFFLQSLLVPTFGSDGALWSLANEFWYYLLFPLGYFALRSRTPRLERLLCLFLFLASAWFVRNPILQGFPVWLAGTALLLVPPPRFSRQAGRIARVLAALFYVPVFFGLALNHSLNRSMSDYLLTVATFALLWTLRSAKQRFAPHSPFVRTSRQLARFSYTLYAVHLPMLVFLASLSVRDTRWQPTLPHVFAALLLLALPIPYAYTVATLTEFRTDSLRRRIERILRLPSPPSALPSNPT